MTWIPTAERLPEQQPSRLIIVQDHDGARYTVSNAAVASDRHITWMELPPPYVPPKQKRRSGWFKPNRLDHFKQSQDAFEAIEILPGDPDPDVVLGILKEMQHDSANDLHYTPTSYWMKRIEESRSK